jgi:hypothetical protein
MTKRFFTNRGRVFCASFSLLTLFLLPLTPASATKNDVTQLRTRLAGAAINGEVPSGDADFRVEPARNRSRFTVEVEDVHLPVGTTLIVDVQHSGVSTTVGSIILNADGSGELRLNSQNGDTVPALVTGDVVIVTHGGIAILAGVL